MVRSDRHPEFPREISEDLVSGGAIGICLHSPQSSVAQRDRRCGLGTSPAALRCRRRCRSGRRASASAPLGGLDFPEPRQHPLGDLQLVELGCQLFAVGVEPRESFHYLLLLLSNLFHTRHLLSLPCPIRKTPQCVTAPIFCNK